MPTEILVSEELLDYAGSWNAATQSLIAITFRRLRAELAELLTKYEAQERMYAANQTLLTEREKQLVEANAALARGTGMFADLTNLFNNEKAARERAEELLPKAIEFAVEWTMKQLSHREEWPQSWDAGFPSYKASALSAFQEQALKGKEEPHA